MDLKYSFEKKIKNRDNSKKTKKKVYQKLNLPESSNWDDAKLAYNNLIKTENQTELNSKILNPITNRYIKKYSIFNKDGSFKPLYKNKLGFIDGKLTKRDDIILAVNNQNLETLKFNKTQVTDTFLQTAFSENVVKSQLVTGNTIGEFDLIESIPSEVATQLTVKIGYTLKWSESVWTDTQFFSDKFTPSQINDKSFWLQKIKDNNPEASDIFIDDPIVLTSQNNATLDLIDMELRHAIPLNIDNIFNEKIINKNYKHCIHDYMIDLYKKKFSHDEIKKIKTTRDVHKFCVKYDIKLIVYNFNKDVISSNYPVKKHKIKSMIYIAYNSHLYAITSEYLHKKKSYYSEIKIVENLKTIVTQCLNNNILPSLEKDGEQFTQVVVDDTLFIQNQDYNKCLEILEKFGLKDKIYPTIKITHLGNILEKLYSKKTNSQSFFPYASEFNKSAFNYHNKDLNISKENLASIDGIKYYISHLLKLKYLIKVDIKTHKHRKFDKDDFFTNNNKIIPHYIYAISVKNSNIILQNNGFYIGETLIYAKNNNLEFTILEEIETEKVENYFIEMINDLYTKCSEKDLKNIMNILIGQFECSNYNTCNNNIVKNKLKFNRFLDETELKTFNGQTQSFIIPRKKSKNKINDLVDEDVYIDEKRFTIGFDVEQSFNIFNRKPIAMQIKDNSRITLHKQIVKMGLNRSNIKQIKTDSITFDKSQCKNIEKYIYNNFSGWKHEKYVEYIPKEIIQKSLPTFEYKNNDLGYLEIGYAGCGKTYHIINNVIPKYHDNKLEKDKQNYIVLTPTNISLDEYQKEDFNCDVIQSNTFNSNKIPKEQNIIVDEIGMVDNAGWCMLFRCFLVGKNIMGFGDFNQLKPVNGKSCDNHNFHKLIFNKIIYNKNNYRNNFTTEFYDNIINNNVNASELINKYNTKFDEAEIIIAYKNTTRIEYNKKMCKLKKIKNLYSVGAKIMCKTNYYKINEIYNNQCFIVKKYRLSDEKLEFTNGQFLHIKKDLIKKYFDYAYCKTLYCVQGSTLKSFHYCLEDIKFLENDGSSLYTLISRLKN